MLIPLRACASTDAELYHNQAADPNWDSIRIENAHLESHLERRELMPAVLVEDHKYITSFDPATTLHIGTIVADNDADIAEKIDKAARSQLEWSETTFGQRRRVIRSLLKWLVDNQAAVAKVACRDTGKTCELSFAHITFQSLTVDASDRFCLGRNINDLL